MSFSFFLFLLYYFSSGPYCVFLFTAVLLRSSSYPIFTSLAILASPDIFVHTYHVNTNIYIANSEYQRHCHRLDSIGKRDSIAAVDIHYPDTRSISA